MKVTVVKLKTATLIALMTWSISSFAQVEMMMYVMRNGEVVFSSPVSGVDNVTFDEATPDTLLFVGKSDSSPADKIRLNDIQQLSFSDENLSVETSSGSEEYVYEDVVKLFFGNKNTIGINTPHLQNGFDVFVFVNSAGDLIVESSAIIKSLTLFSVEGTIISNSNVLSVFNVLNVFKNLPTGIYLLRVETEQGTIVKKVVKPSNK